MEILLQSLTVGQYIRHFQYGCGVITDSDASRTTIDFDLYGVKKFVTSLVVVEPAEGVPPKRSKTKGRKKTGTKPSTAASLTGAK
jgi:hypothetical protein